MSGAAPAVAGVETARWEPVIGLEVHAQLLTRSKMFCGCPAQYVDRAPNTNVCPVCLGLPGTLPVINREAVEMTVRTALALDCEIARFTKFDRKNYFYPDLPKGYQISQYDMPLSHHGRLVVGAGDGAVTAGITRVHLEEDTGTMHHEGDVLQHADSSLVDFNRSGVPLMEIVGEPDLRSAEQAREYLHRLRQLLVYIGVNDGNLEEGSFRCDANVSLRPAGSDGLGTKVEIKNMNSFRAVQRALEHEIARQVAVLDSGGRVDQETRGWVEARGATLPQRSKEYAHDYRYFPDPDLPPLRLEDGWIEGVRSRLPELPAARAARLVAEHGIPAYDAAVLTDTREDADAWEALVATGVPAKIAANWQMGDVTRLARETRTPLSRSGLGVEGLGRLLRLVDAGVVSGTTAKELLDELYLPGGDAEAIVRERGLGAVRDDSALVALVDAALVAEPVAVADYRGGKAQALGRLVGHVMKASGGKADARRVNELLRERLDA
ncbi:MAG TPA: Asp-tRNA(Asn)/Glu-tRNA(Gln) amidotransferase subunit GatB [Candidatus Dormibacteraeota bacterium]|nr:Asp-tRNA(Asn)/Glu-tRNA(Gln) amidotransferase subunit GatB [Candidatus Dormibacteraeota bacterium]